MLGRYSVELFKIYTFHFGVVFYFKDILMNS